MELMYQMCLCDFPGDPKDHLLGKAPCAQNLSIAGLYMMARHRCTHAVESLGLGTLANLCSGRKSHD